jgi:site-specific recombinase XerD
MAAASVILDKRVIDKNGTYRLKLRITNNNSQAYISLPYKLRAQDWDEKNSRIRKSCDIYNVAKENVYLNDYKNKFDDFLLNLSKKMNLQIFTAAELKEKYLGTTANYTIETLFKEFIAIKIADNPGASTASLYELTLDHISKFKKRTDFNIEIVNTDFLTSFDNYLKENNSVNSRSIHLRNLRAVYNYAVKKGIANYADYPFRQFKIKNEKTMHRVLCIEHLRLLFNHVSEIKQRNKALDIFKLSFYLVGINIKDLLYLQHNDIVDKRLYYSRFKTGAKFNILIVPEAMEIINRYPGEKYLLNFIETKIAKTSKDRLNVAHKDIINTTNKRLYLILKEELKIDINISTYYARHTWATLARKQGVAKDIIRFALGHSDKSVTDIYIDYAYDVVDEANAKVLELFD